MIRSVKAKIVIVLAGLVALSGCASVGSSIASRSGGLSGSGAAGPVYLLPIKSMKVAVGSNGNGLFVAVADARVEGDVTAAYALRYNPDSSSEDQFDVAIDKDTGLLKSAKAEADSKAADAINSLGDSVGRVAGVFESFIGDGKTQIYATRPLVYYASHDESDPAAALKSLMEAVNAMVRDTIDQQGCALRNADVLGTDLQKSWCNTSQHLRADAPVPRVSLTIDYKPFRSSGLSHDCSVGICTRVQSMAQFVLTANGSTDAERIALPNGSDPVAIPLRRVGFTKSTTEVLLEDGLVTSVTYHKGAELPAITAAPGNFVGALVGGFIKGVADQSGLRKAKTDSIQSRADAAKARADAAKTQAEAVKALAGISGKNEANFGTESDFQRKAMLIVYVLGQPRKALPASLSHPAAADVGTKEKPDTVTETNTVDDASTKADGDLGPTTPPGPDTPKEAANKHSAKENAKAK